MEGDRMLLTRAADFLAQRTTRSIKVTPGQVDAAGKRKISIQTRGLKRLDFYVNGRPQGSVDLPVNATGDAQVSPSVDVGAMLVLNGFAETADEVPGATHRGLVN
jgi:hypothetical protein